MNSLCVLLLAVLAAMSSAAFPSIWTAGTPLLYLTPGSNVSANVNNSEPLQVASMISAMLPPFTSRATFYFTQESSADLFATMGAGFYGAYRTADNMYTAYSDFSSTASSPSFTWAGYASGYDSSEAFALFFSTASPVNLYFTVAPYFASSDDAGNYTAIFQDVEYLRQYNGTGAQSIEFFDDDYQVCFNTSLGNNVRSVNVSSSSSNWYLYVAPASALEDAFDFLTYSEAVYATPAPAPFVLGCARSYYTSSDLTGTFSMTVDSKCTAGQVWWRGVCVTPTPAAIASSGTTVMFNSTADAAEGYKIWALTLPATTFVTDLNISCDGCGGFEQFFYSRSAGQPIDPQLNDDQYIYSSGVLISGATGMGGAFYYFAWEQYYSSESTFNLTFTPQCPNQCAGQGTCVAGQCACNAGRFGTGCEIGIYPIVAGTPAVATLEQYTPAVFQFNQTSASSAVYCNISNAQGSSFYSFSTIVYRANLTTQQPMGVIASQNGGSSGEASFYMPFVPQGNYVIVATPTGGSSSSYTVTATCTFPANPSNPNGGSSNGGSGSESDNASALGFTFALIALIALLL